MIKKTFIAFLVLLAGYAFIRDIAKPEVILAQSAWQWNQYVAQDFLYSKDEYKNILVGSSMSFHLELDKSAYQIHNLALTGESSNKGIGLILKKGELTKSYPKFVFIETNTLDAYNRSSFDDALYNPFLLIPRKYSTIFRDGKQPLPWLAVLLEKNVTPRIIPHRISFMEDKFGVMIQNVHMREEKEKEEIIPNERLKKMVLSDNEISEMEKGLTTSIDRLIKNNCVPIFFEAPVATKHRTSEKYNSIRKIIQKHYPEPKFTFIHNPLDSNFQTYDGFHLTKIDMERYSTYLCSKIDSIISTDNEQYRYE